MTSPVRYTSIEVQRMILFHLREMGYKARTSELAKDLRVPSSVVRRAGLYLQSKGRLRAELQQSARGGKGEYLFILEQLDLFDDQKKEVPKPGLWQRLKAWFKS
jgi:predicted transcriptional regulator